MIYLGVPIDLAACLFTLLKDGVTALYVISRCRYEAKCQQEWLTTASPHERYRFHVRNGGYRPI